MHSEKFKKCSFVHTNIFHKITHLLFLSPVHTTQQMIIQISQLDKEKELLIFIKYDRW